MHGTVFIELQQFIETKIKLKWNDLLKNTPSGFKIFRANENYEDKEMLEIIGAAAAASKTTSREVLEGFGKFMAPSMIKTNLHLINPKWDVLELVEHTKDVFEKIISRNVAGSQMPVITSKRISNDEIIIFYSSPRKICAYIRGLILGFGAEYKVDILVLEPSCMLNGNPNCQIIVRLNRKKKDELSVLSKH